MSVEPMRADWCIAPAAIVCRSFVCNSALRMMTIVACAVYLHPFGTLVMEPEHPWHDRHLHLSEGPHRCAVVLNSESK